MGGKHGGQAGMPKPEDRSSAQQGIVRDERDKSNRQTKSVLSMSAAKTEATIRLAIQSSEQNAGGLTVRWLTPISAASLARDSTRNSASGAKFGRPLS
jgi:hypothetical protein